jgi:hypothetical protein
MSDKPVLFVVNFSEGVLARAWLNELPVHKFLAEGPDSMTGGANHWLVPGENTLTIEVLRVPAGDKWSITMKLYTVKNEHSTPPDLNILHQVELADYFRALPEERRAAPFLYTARFTPDTDVSEPVYLSAPPASFGCDGTPELRQAVKDLHDALVSHDVDGFIRLTSLKDEEYERAFPGQPSATVARQQQSSRKFFSLRPRIKPLDWKILHFEPRVGGRVAYVTGADHEPAIEAIAEDDPSLRLRANLLLTQYAGRWRVFG